MPIGVPQRDAGIELVRLGDEARLYDQILKNDWILKTDSENLRTTGLSSKIYSAHFFKKDSYGRPAGRRLESRLDGGRTASVSACDLAVYQAEPISTRCDQGEQALLTAHLHLSRADAHYEGEE